MAWEFQRRGQAHGEPRVGGTVVRIRSFNYPNNQSGLECGEGLSSSLKGLQLPLHVFALPGMEQNALVLGPCGTGNQHKGEWHGFVRGL